MPQYIWLALHLQFKFSVFWQGLHKHQQEARAPLGAPALAVPYPQVLTAMPQHIFLLADFIYCSFSHWQVY